MGILELAEKSDTLDLNLEIPLPEDSRSRSLKTDIEAIISASGDEENKEKNVEAGDGNDANIDLEKLFEEQVKAEISKRRRRRDTVTTPKDNSETQFPDVQGRQHAHFGPNGVKPPTCGGPASGMFVVELPQLRTDFGY